jgi:hypothetical protein
MFVIKYDRDGRVLWRRIVGSGTSSAATGVAVDASGNVVITGYFGNSITFGATTLTCSARSNVFNGVASNIYVDANIFVAMLDRDGIWQWARQFEFALFSSTTADTTNRGTDLPVGNDIALRTDYTGGQLERTAGFRSGPRPPARCRWEVSTSRG